MSLLFYYDDMVVVHGRGQIFNSLYKFYLTGMLPSNKMEEAREESSVPRPTPRTSTSTTSTAERKKKATSTIISIGGDQQMSTTAPLVSPEATTDIDKATTEERPIIVATTADDAKDTRRSSSSSSSTEVKASTVYIKAATEDESSTDPVLTTAAVAAVTAAAAPPPPPRPSKASSSSSSAEASPKHVLSPSAAALKLPLDATVSSETIKETSDVGSLVDDETSKGFSSQQWGTERRVELRRVAGQGLGISIVGGKVDTKESGNFPITGIFIKNVLPGSPADECGQLFTGDRILEVDGHDLRQASHDKAVDVIRQSGNVVVFVVQSLLGLSRNESSTNLEGESSTDEDDEHILTDTAEMNNEEEEHHGPPVPPPEFANDEAIITDNRKTKDSDNNDEEMPLPPVPPPPQHADDDDDDEDDEEDEPEDYLGPELTGQVTLSSGAVIDKASAAYLQKRANDPDTEDDFGYTLAKIRQKYSKKIKDAPGAQVVYVCINKGSNGLGISLAGDKDRSQSAVYICGLNPSGNAARDGRMKEGDLILEVNGMVLHNRHHLNAAAVIKGLPELDNTFVLLRSPSGLNQVAVKPLTQFPPEPFKDNPIERYRNYKGVREVTIEKGDRGWGIMIIEGRHAEIGVGVFISDIQEGSCAQEAGLIRGDLILSVNGEDFVGVSYNSAAKILKNSQGTVKLIVANSNINEDATKKIEPVGQSSPESSSDAAPPPPPPPVAEDKPKIAPKPTIAPKPAGLSPSHKPETKIPLPSSKSTPAPPPPPPSSAQPKLSPKPASKQKPVASPRRKEDANNPANCEIVPGSDTAIEITKDKDESGKPMGLGLSIVGGSDTLLGAIFIHEVYEKGAAHKDGRLRPGDQILEVMNEDLRNVTHAHALHALRQTPNRVRLMIHREDDEIYETLEVELHKKKDRGLGLSIVGKKSGPGVYISEVNVLHFKKEDPDLITITD